MPGSRERIERQTSMPLPSGQPGVQNRHVRPQRWDDPLGLHGRAALSHHDEIVLGLEQVAQSVPDDLVVIEQEDPNRVP